MHKRYLMSWLSSHLFNHTITFLTKQYKRKENKINFGHNNYMWGT